MDVFGAGRGTTMGAGDEMCEEKSSIFQMRFPQKLWWLVGRGSCAGGAGREAVLWGSTGRTILLNYRVLDGYLRSEQSVFKTTHISSFIRQLNLYGFRKVTSHLQDPLCNSSNPHMHEYIHDFFVYGHPELLDKITRKALNMKRAIKPLRSLYPDIGFGVCMTPLQKARRALRIALVKAAQELFYQDTTKNNYMEYEYEDASECDQNDNIDYDWTSQPNIQPNENADIKPSVTNGVSIEYTAPPTNENDVIMIQYNNNQYNEPLHGNFEPFITDELAFVPESVPTNEESFTNQFLSMPDLSTVKPETSHDDSYASYNNNDSMEGQYSESMHEIESVRTSLNCVLPAVCNDLVDNSALNENVWKVEQTGGHYHGEWDQMFKDIMTSKEPTQGTGTDLKELYYQISTTIDLLNT